MDTIRTLPYNCSGWSRSAWFVRNRRLQSLSTPLPMHMIRYLNTMVLNHRTTLEVLTEAVEGAASDSIRRYMKLDMKKNEKVFVRSIVETCQSLSVRLLFVLNPETVVILLL